MNDEVRELLGNLLEYVERNTCLRVELEAFVWRGLGRLGH